MMTESTVTTQQFISFETISAIVFSLFVGVCGWAWSSVDKRFEKVDQRFEKVDQRFEKAESKQDAIMVMLARIEAKMATKELIFIELPMSLGSIKFPTISCIPPTKNKTTKAGYTSPN